MNLSLYLSERYSVRQLTALAAAAAVSFAVCALVSIIQGSLTMALMGIASLSLMYHAVFSLSVVQKQEGIDTAEARQV